MDDQSFIKSNPFPANPVAGESIDQLPNFSGTKSYHEVSRRLEIYRERFFRQQDGLALGISGSIGSGKTHLILQVLSNLQKVESPPFKLLLTTMESADFLNFYVNHFVRKIEANGLKDIVSLHFAKLLRGRVSSVESTSEESKTFAKIATEEVDRLAANNPQGILQLVKKDLLPGKDLTAELDNEIAGIKETPKGLATDFFIAYSSLTDSHVGSLALRWLQGEILSQGERKTLGLETLGITSSDQAKEALRFLLAAFKKAGYGLVLCVDEFERFALREGAVVKESTPLLRDLGETFANTGHVLIVSGVADAWKKMPEDVFGRIKRPEIVQVKLSREEAEGVLKAYARQDIATVFAKDALELLFEVSEFNARRLLTLAFYAYEAWAIRDTQRAGLILTADVTIATNRLLSGSIRVDNAERAIRALADTLGLSCRSQGEIANFKYDFMLGDLNDKPVVVEVRRSLFKLDEVQSARSIATASQSIRREYPEARFCIVVVGYSTPEVRNELARIADRVFYYDEEKFPDEFSNFVSSFILSTSRTDVAPITNEVYKDLDERFDKIEKAREKELEQIKHELERMRAEAARSLEEERAKRVTDKLVVPLAELESALQSEEESALRAKSKAESSLRNADEKLSFAIELLDHQRSAISEAQILNEKLPYEKEFSRQLHGLSDLTQTAEEIWTDANRIRNAGPDEGTDFFLDDYYEVASLRELFRQRKDVLKVLEALHAWRVSEARVGVMAQLVGAIRRISLVPVILAVLSVIGFLFVSISVYISWSVEKTERDRYLSSFAEVQKAARQLILTPGLDAADSTQGPIFSRSLVTAFSTVEGEKAAALRFGIENQIEDIGDLTAIITANLNGNRDIFPEKFHEATLEHYSDAAELILYNCRSASSKLEAVTFSSFLLRFWRENPWTIRLGFLPVIALLAFISYRRLRALQRRRLRARSRITKWDIQLKEEFKNRF